MKKPLMEICCGSADDVIEAYQAGADRVELNSAMFLGGLTPTLGALMTAKRHTDIPVMCMVRPREGGFCYTQHEFEHMLEDVRLLLAHGADGIVFGVLNADGSIDRERCARMMETIGDKPAVFHRAIDVTPDWKATLDVLMELGVTRVLTSGQKPSVLAGAETIRGMIAHAKGRIEILPGGDILPETAQLALEQTGAEQFHLMLSKSCRDTSAMKNPSIHFGGALYPSEEVFGMSDREAIAALQKRVQH